MELGDLMRTVQSATRRGLFRQKHVFELSRVASPGELTVIERKAGIALPSDLRCWLLTLGYGNIDEVLSFQETWFVAIELGQLKGGSLFAQDIFD